MEFQTPSSKKNSALTIHSDVAFLFVPMRLLTHNTLRNNSAAAKGKGFPLKITATEIRVDEPNQDNDDREREIAFAKKMLVMLDWSALVQVRFSIGLEGLFPLHLLIFSWHDPKPPYYPIT